MCADWSLNSSMKNRNEQKDDWTNHNRWSDHWSGGMDLSWLLKIVNDWGIEVIAHDEPIEEQFL